MSLSRAVTVAMESPRLWVSGMLRPTLEEVISGAKMFLSTVIATTVTLSLAGAPLS